MKIKLPIAIVLLCFSLTVKGQAEELIKECFNSYKSAILNNDSKEAVKYVHANTINYYQDMLDHCLNSDSATLAKLNILDRFMVLAIRFRIKADFLKTANGAILLEKAIDLGMVGKSSVVNNTIGAVERNEDFATGQMLVSGKPVPSYMHFHLVDGKWLMDLTALFPAAIIAMEQMALQSQQTENEFILGSIKLVTGFRPNADIWKPLNKN